MSAIWVWLVVADGEWFDERCVNVKSKHRAFVEDEEWDFSAGFVHLNATRVVEHDTHADGDTGAEVSDVDDETVGFNRCGGFGKHETRGGCLCVTDFD